MGTLNSWTVIDANNNAVPPDGWPENTMNYSDVNDTGRAVQGTVKRFFADINGSLDAAGIADAYTLTLNETGYAAYFDGLMFACTIPVDNATATPTIDVNGIGAATIVNNEGNPLGVGALIGGGVYNFQHDGTNLRLAGGGGGSVGGVDTELQFNNAGISDGASNLTYDGTELSIASALNLSTDIVMTEQADHSSTPVGGFGYLWTRNDAPSQLIFTDDDGNDTVLGAGGTGTPALPANSIQFNNGGAFGGDAGFTYNGSLISITDPVSANVTGVLGGTAYNFAGDPSTGRTMNISSSGSGEALRVSGGAIVCAQFLNSIELEGSAAIRMEGAGNTYSTIDQDTGGTDFQITSGLENGDLRMRVGEPGREFIVETYDGLFTNRALTMDGFSTQFAAASSGAGTTRLEITPTVINANLPINITDAAAGQIVFPATQNPSTNLNTLDDYEEDESFAATFTPTTSGTITIDTSNDELAYVKIGRMVFLQGEISVLSVSSPVGNVEIPLPFTSMNAPGAASQDQLYLSCWITNLSGLPDNFYTLFIDRGANVATIQQFDGITPIADNFQSTTVVSINAAYMADA